jgi:hypothetical protein
LASPGREASSAAAANLPDLQAAGRTGKTLLYFAVGQTWHQEHKAEAVKTLLSFGADPNRVAPDGMTFAKMLTAHRDQFARQNEKPRPDFQPLWDWAESQGIFSPPQ